jgi:hypothetical protein
MSYYSFHKDIDIRQGDVIQKLGFSTSPSLGIILTADCDIANNKHGNIYNWIEVISARDFLEKIWAKDQLNKLIEKQGENLVKFLNAAIFRTNNTLDSLTLESLNDWLQEKTADDIFASLFINNENELKKLKAIRLALGYEEESIQNLPRLERARELFGQKRDALFSSANNSLNSFGDGFSDFFFIPDLPLESKDLGYVALFRNIYSVEKNKLFMNKLDARTHDDSFFVIGRLEDRIRFAIMQKLSFVFLRIGMDDHYEEECKISRDLLIDKIFQIEA